MYIILALPVLLRLKFIDFQCCHIRSFNVGNISNLEFVSTFIDTAVNITRKSLMLVEDHGVFWKFLRLGNK